MSINNPDQTPVDPDTGLEQEPSLPEPSDAEASPDPNRPDEGFGAGESGGVDPDLALDDPTDETQAQ